MKTFCCISGMGNAESATKKQQTSSGRQLPRGVIKHRKMPFDTKKILFLHKSDGAQLRAVRNFRDAITAKGEGTIHLADFINIADGYEIPKSLAWLNERHNLVLICLTSESIGQLHKIILEKGFADQNGHLHPKVFSVTFGGNLDSEWPPEGLKKGASDLRDFHFGFSDVEKLQPEDFEKLPRLNSLIAAIKLTH